MPDNHMIQPTVMRLTSPVVAHTHGVGKSITRPADPLTAVTPQIKVHAATWRAVLNSSGPLVTRYTWAQNNKTNKRWRKLLYLQIRPTHPVTLAPSQMKAGSFVTKVVTGENIPKLTIRYSYLNNFAHRCFILLLLQGIPT